MIFYEKIWNNFWVGNFILDYVCEWWRRILVKIINRCGTAQKIKFSLRIPSVNVTKSAVSCEFGKSLIENFILSAVWMAPLKFLSQDLTPFLISLKIFMNSLNQNLNFLKKLRITLEVRKSIGYTYKNHKLKYPVLA